MLQKSSGSDCSAVDEKSLSTHSSSVLFPMTNCDSLVQVAKNRQYQFVDCLRHFLLTSPCHYPNARNALLAIDTWAMGDGWSLVIKALVPNQLTQLQQQEVPPYGG